jgi:hypothetical protein
MSKKKVHQSRFFTFNTGNIEYFACPSAPLQALPHKLQALKDNKNIICTKITSKKCA